MLEFKVNSENKEISYIDFYYKNEEGYVIALTEKIHPDKTISLKEKIEAFRRSARPGESLDGSYKEGTNQFEVKEDKKGVVILMGNLNHALSVLYKRQIIDNDIYKEITTDERVKEILKATEAFKLPSEHDENEEELFPEDKHNTKNQPEEKSAIPMDNTTRIKVGN